MFGVGADVGEEAPAAFALGTGANFDGGGEFAEDGVGEAFLGKGELHSGFDDNG